MTRKPSPRQVEVLRHLAAGYSQEATAAKLKITVGTLKSYTVEARMRLDVATNDDAIRALRRTGRITDAEIDGLSQASRRKPKR